jgi:hypothetical protein
MANEISTTLVISASKGRTKARFAPGQIKTAMSAEEIESGTIVATSGAGVTLAASTVAAEGLLILRNLGADNSVFFGVDDGGPRDVGELTTDGLPAMFVLKQGVTLSLRTATGSSPVWYQLLSR